MNRCPDCATPDLCRIANYDCGHDELKSKGDNNMTEPEIHPAHYAIQKTWRGITESIARTKGDIAQNLHQLEAQQAELIKLEVARDGLEEHAAQQGWLLTTPKIPEGLNTTTTSMIEARAKAAKEQQ